MENKKVIAEIDILLENSDTIMVVEVKVKPAVKDAEEVIQRIETLRNWRNKRNDNRKIQGAIAGAIFGAAQKKATARAGLYVIQQSGDTMKIDLPEGFSPREW
jgi:RecB family endonuclease NucS